MPFITSELLNALPNIQHGFGNEDEPFPLHLLESFQSRGPTWKQVHGSKITEVSTDRQDCGEVDGLLTFRQSLPIAIKTADCVPILLAKRDGTAVATLHAGWRGTLLDIAGAFAARLHQLKESPQDWIAVTGPSIGGCCYRVDANRIDSFIKKFPKMPSSSITPLRQRLDLQKINHFLLKQAGFHQVEMIQICTYCSTLPGPTFFSFRKNATQSRQWSVVRIC